MDANGYKPVEDGWKDRVKPALVEVKDDHFNENSLVVELAFRMGEGFEMPRAKIPLLYGAGHKVAKWKDGVKTEHDATQTEQREAFALLGAIFPKWAEWCKGGHTTQEMLYWFENEGREDVLATEMDIKVSHSASGFPNARVKDPRNAKPKKERVTKAEVLTRAAAAFASVFGASLTGAAATAKSAGGDEDIPF